MNKANIHIYENENRLFQQLTELFLTIGNQSILDRNRFIVALSGGNSPKQFYRILSQPEYRSQIDWTKVFFFFGDERYVPLADPANNAGMARTFLFDPLDITPVQYFPVDTRLSPKKAAVAYWKTIQSFFPRQEVRFDFIFLGLGDNAHTASLFPHTAILAEQNAEVAAVYVPELNSERISFTAPLINQARNVAFLVFGENKANAVLQVLKSKKDPLTFPAQLIELKSGNLYWFLDQKASRLLNQ